MRSTCRTQIRCSQCRGPHHTTLHLPRQVSMDNRDHGGTRRRNTEEPQASTGEQEVALSGMHVRTAIPKSLLATARVRIVGPQGVGITVRALLDQGSQSSFVHRDLLHHLTLPVHKVNAQIFGINETREEHVKQMVSCSVESLTEPGWTIAIRVLVVGRMTGILVLPSQDLRIPVPSSWKALPLADPQFETSGRVDVILGADLCAQKTRLFQELFQENYRIISGKLPGEGEGSPHMVYNIRVNYEEKLDNILRRFWEVEEIPIRPAKSGADEFCEELCKTKVQRTDSGRYIVPLPFDPKVPVPELFGGSVSICVQRQLSLERRLAKQVPLKKEYHSFMREYIKLGHMTPLPELVAEDSPGGCFIPHHAVWRNQRKLRAVFDASTVTSNGFSFNNRLYTGPKLQSDIFSILMNWRHHKIVMLADIEKVYRQVLVCLTDAVRQKILWRETSNEPIIPYRLNTVTYGTSPAPFLALRTLVQLAIDEGSQYPRAAEALKKETRTLISITKGGFVLKKWASNDPTILNQIPEDARLKKIRFDGAEVAKTLGLGWDPAGGYFLYSFQEPTQGDEITKRGMLSLVEKLYDPMGWLAPVIVVGKILNNRLWVPGKDWDAPIDGPIKEQWKKFREQLGCLRTVRILRWLGLMGIQDIQRCLRRCVVVEGTKLAHFSRDQWPKMPTITGRPEIRTALSVGLVDQVPLLVALGERFSSITTYNRVVAWILSFSSNCRGGKFQSPLNPAEIKRAHVEILLVVQQHYFGEELKSLSRHKIVGGRSRILSLNPFQDEQGVLRGGGRLRRAPGIPYHQKYPALLPSEGRLSQLIIRDRHQRTHHGGAQLVLSNLRQEYWILRAKDQIKKRVRDNFVK
ncbi:hypothetical protein LAZ67_18001380 [Cordylochernes scorpioides]|uniref:Peptidase A2 domain-containing protein n=1 Tax=Cordylochernes scorpioides TaxID=51811 RepID=A0ABY6LFN6_9ARAC|nr:hypothetical protein LAZ67_18001380 [Cordylochernes scorpioides]